ncbi:hypothetical protein TNCV_820861 [Trichonephila clavipes]|nr:hypothetical protein TNCV_820861 [Trichonephila clavipes]
MQDYDDQQPSEKDIVQPEDISNAPTEKCLENVGFILTLGARYNTGLRTSPTGDELCFYTLRNIREIPSMHSKE